jgi:vacuolar-type H+-ATPase subunit H
MNKDKIIQMWLDAEEENRNHTQEGDDKCNELKDKFISELDKLSEEDKKYVKDYLDDLAA